MGFSWIFTVSGEGLYHILDIWSVISAEWEKLDEMGARAPTGLETLQNGTQTTWTLGRNFCLNFELPPKKIKLRRLLVRKCQKTSVLDEHWNSIMVKPWNWWASFFFAVCFWKEKNSHCSQPTHSPPKPQSKNPTTKWISKWLPSHWDLWEAALAINLGSRAVSCFGWPLEIRWPCGIFSGESWPSIRHASCSWPTSPSNNNQN